MTDTKNTTNASFGEKWDPLCPEQLSDPYPFYSRARTEAPVFYSKILDMWVVTRYQDLMRAFNEPLIFSSENTAPSEEAAKVASFLYPASNAVGTNPPSHTRLRAPLNPAFTPARLAAMKSSIRDRANALVDTMCKNKEVDIVSEFASPLPLGTVIELFGGSQDDMADFEKYSAALIAFMTSPMTPLQFKEASKNIEHYHQYLRSLIARKRANPGQDLTSDLVTFPSEPPLSENELVSTLTGLLFAGHPTIRCLMGSMMLTFLSTPSRWQALLNDHSLIPSAVEEVLRLTSPVPSVIRRSTQDIAIGGTTIPAKARVLLLMNSGNHDPSEFPEPAEYILDRPHAAGQLTLAKGPHECAGRALARLQAQIGLEVLLDRLPNLHLVEGQSLEYLPTLVIRGLRSLRVSWD